MGKTNVDEAGDYEGESEGVSVSGFVLFLHVKVGMSL